MYMMLWDKINLFNLAESESQFLNFFLVPRFFFLARQVTYYAINGTACVVVV
jgi:hypothetical protein